MSKLIIDFFAYLKAVFLESGRWVFAIFDVLGILLFFQPKFAENLLQNSETIRAVGGSLFLFSFLIANFTLFRKLIPQPLNDESLLLLPHRTKTSNAVLMKYIGSERVDKLVVVLSYKDKNAQSKQIPVVQFFPSSDSQMLYNAGPINFMEPGQEAYFYLLGGEDNSEGKVTVLITFAGAKSGTKVKIERVFPLVENWYMS